MAVQVRPQVTATARPYGCQGLGTSGWFPTVGRGSLRKSMPQFPHVTCVPSASR
jgi:hypothetical protein